MIGAIIGDVIGSRFEFNNTRDYNFNLWDDSCSYTDDTICTLAIADAILTGECYKSKLLKWCGTYPHPMGAYGGRFAQWIHSEDPQPYNSFGNGSAMRVSPVAWAFDELEIVKEEAEKTALCTHNHPEGIKGAVAVAHAIWWFRMGWGKSLREWCDTMQQYYPGFDSQHFEQGRFDETCQGTVPLCLQIIYQATDFEDAIRRAISFGGDSDTIGAIVGSIAEARFGIPQEFIDKVYRYLDPRMVDQLRIWHTFLSKNDLKIFCRYYGKKDIKNDPETETLIKIEKFWVDATEALTEEKDTLKGMIQEYTSAGLNEFEQYDKVPLSLKAVLFNRYCKHNERIDVEGFKSYYKNVYIKGVFSGITEDYSNYTWYKGEKENPYQGDQERPLAAQFWEYEREFHLNYLDSTDTSQSLADAYKLWKAELIHQHLPGKSPNPYGDQTDWEKTFETGRKY